jgi:hypothetical protein
MNRFANEKYKESQQKPSTKKEQETKNHKWHQRKDQIAEP